MIVDFDETTVSYNFEPCCSINVDEDAVTIDLTKLSNNTAKEFLNDAEAFLSAIRAHGFRTKHRYLICEDSLNETPFMQSDFEELGFTFL